MTSKSKRWQPAYIKRREEALEKRNEAARNEDSLSGYVLRVLWGNKNRKVSAQERRRNVDRVCEYLISGEPLSDEDREMLALLISRLARPKMTGPHRGVLHRSASRREGGLVKARARICATFAMLREEERKRECRKRLKKGRASELLAQAIWAEVEQHPDNRRWFVEGSLLNTDQVSKLRAKLKLSEK